MLIFRALDGFLSAFVCREGNNGLDVTVLCFLRTSVQRGREENELFPKSHDLFHKTSASLLSRADCGVFFRGERVAWRGGEERSAPHTDPHPSCQHTDMRGSGTKGCGAPDSDLLLFPIPQLLKENSACRRHPASAASSHFLSLSDSLSLFSHPPSLRHLDQCCLKVSDI